MPLRRVAAHYEGAIAGVTQPLEPKGCFGNRSAPPVRHHAFGVTERERGDAVRVAMVAKMSTRCPGNEAIEAVIRFFSRVVLLRTLRHASPHGYLITASRHPDSLTEPVEPSSLPGVR